MKPLEIITEGVASALLNKDRLVRLQTDFDDLKKTVSKLADLYADLNVRVARIEEREGREKERVDAAIREFQMQVREFELRLRQLPPSSQ